MPWLTIIMAILTFLLQGGTKKENRTKALLSAGLVGAGTYYLSHETEWGQRNLGEFDGVNPPEVGALTPVVKDAVTGQPVDVGGNPVKVGSGSNGWDVLKQWGPLGTAAVAGVGGGILTGNNKMLWVAGAAVVALMILK